MEVIPIELTTLYTSSRTLGDPLPPFNLETLEDSSSINPQPRSHSTYYRVHMTLQTPSSLNRYGLLLSSYDLSNHQKS